LYIETM